MRAGYKRILFAVRDVERIAPASLRRLASLAGKGAKLEIYHALTETVAVDRARAESAGRSLDAVFDSLAADATKRLARSARGTVLRGIKVTTHVDWDYPAHEAILRRAASIKADIVVVEVRPHRTGARFFLRNTDWELIRSCPLPLLLLKGTRNYRRGAVLVAVDPFHAADKPASLDRQLLASGARLARGLGGSLHAVHAWLPLAVSLPAVASMPAPPWLPAEVEAKHEARIRRAFQRLVRPAGVKRANEHCDAGPVPDVVDAALRASKAAVLVMGAVSRRGLKRLFVGNTAEREIDRVACDVLVVKPRGFRSGILARPRHQRPLMIGPVPL